MNQLFSLVPGQRITPALFDSNPRGPALRGAFTDIAEDRPACLKTALAQRLADRAAVVGVVGLGYVGLPLLTAIGAAGFPVRGIDSDPARAALVGRGETGMAHLDARALRELLGSGRAAVSADYAMLGECDVVILCVPTPLTRHREPDLSAIIAASNGVAARLRPGQLVLVESTTYPGTTREVVAPILETSGLVSGRDFFLGYSPEREDPGNRRFRSTEVPKLVAGDGAAALDLALAFYGAVFSRTVALSTPDAAEATKLLENIFRSVNIALVNELKIVFSRMGIDIWEVIEAARTKPFGYMAFYPGPGLGGHCIPIDPFYLTWKAREYGIHTRFIELAGEINSGMPHYVVGTLARALNSRQRSVAGARILLMGVAYKKNLSDVRESPALRIWEELEQLGAEVAFHDPFVAEITDRQHPTLTGRRSIAWGPSTPAHYDAVLICVDHDGVDYEQIARQAAVIVDTRNVMAKLPVAGLLVAS